MVASKGMVPAAMEAGTYEKRYTSAPISNVYTVDTVPAPGPLKPVTEPTTCGGKRSDGRVRPRVDQVAKLKRVKQMSLCGRESNRHGHLRLNLDLLLHCTSAAD